MIKIHGQYEPSDYAKAVKLNSYHKGVTTVQYFIVGWIGLMLVLAVLSLLITGPSDQIFWPGILVLALVLGIWLVVRRVWIPRHVARVFKQQKDLSEPFDMEITDTTFSCQNEFGTTQVPWNIFTKWKENAELFLLYRSDVLFHMLPKRLLQGEDDIRYVRAKLEDNKIPVGS